MLEQDAVQLDASPFRARRVVIQLGESVLLYQSTNQPIRTRTMLHRGLVAYVAFGPQAHGTLNGVPVGPDRFVACASGINVEFVVAPGYESVAFLVSPDDVRAHLRLRRHEIPSLIPQGVELLRTSPGASPGLFECGKRLTDAAVDNPETFDDPRTNSIAQRELFDALSLSIGSVVKSELRPRERTRRAYSRIVQVAEDYAQRHADDPVYVTDLCKAASVSERTLQNAFREIMDMTPVAYLNRLRLHRVRQALRAADSHSTTVSAEALKWGFWHLGEFSRAYKECFGELPTDTLRHHRPQCEERRET